MQPFHATFWENKVFINQKHQYLNNEILVQYLNMGTANLETDYDNLCKAYSFVLLHPNIVRVAHDYNDWTRKLQRILNKLDALYPKMPPYNAFWESNENDGDRLFKCLNRHTDLFEKDDANGYIILDKEGRELFQLSRFEPVSRLWESEGSDKDDFRDDLDVFNKDVRETVTFYLRWLEAVLRVQHVYAKLLDEYLHTRHAFLGEHEVAEQLEAYLQTEQIASKEYKRLRSAEPLTVSHEVFRPEDGKPILCDSFDFDGIGAFLYTDFFRGLRGNHIPKRCQNCGKWFLLPFGKYSDYCENPLPDDSDKTCRSSSARKKYDDKCRTDPVWLCYNRAYKAHYARYMKKKMTNAEFEQWGTYAIELRTKALNKQIPYGEYERLIKV